MCDLIQLNSVTNLEKCTIYFILTFSWYRWIIEDYDNLTIQFNYPILEIAI